MKYLKILIILIVCVGNQHYAASTDESLQSFWVRFRQAVIEGDKERVAAMTRFPFEVGGQVDFCPIHKRSRVEFFDATYQKIMEQTLDYNIVDGQKVFLN